MGLISDFFKSKTKFYQNGSNIPSNIEDSMAFSLLPECDFLLQKQALDKAYVLERISGIYEGASANRLLNKYSEYIKTTNKLGKKQNLILNIDLEDTNAFLNKNLPDYKATLEASKLSGFNKKIFNPRIFLIEKDRDQCIASNRKTRYINISRIMPYNFNFLAQDEFKQSNEAISDFTFFHECAHGLDKNSYHRADDYYQTYKGENFADSYSCLKLLKLGHDNKLLESLLNYRQTSVMEVMGIFYNSKMPFKPKDVQDFLTHHTGESINNIIKMKNEGKLDNVADLSEEDLLKKAKEISDKSIITKQEFNGLSKELCEKEFGAQSQRILKIDVERFNRTGTKNQANLTQNLVKIEDEEVEKIIFKNELELVTNINKEIKDGKSYEEAFLNSYEKQMKLNLNNADLIKSGNINEVSRNLRENLGKKDDLRVNCAVIFEMDKVEIPNDIKNCGHGVDAYEKYIETKINYYNAVNKVYQDVRTNNISLKTKENLDNAVKYSAFAHALATKSYNVFKDEFGNDGVLAIIKGDIYKKPKELVDIFKSSKNEINKNLKRADVFGQFFNVLKSR
ncbi:MAG: hypothetical protein BWY78_00371 [Alphaproteobacteria bacterium ADurb.Bin438]|nr:MAG: hypothetical protein BWY78_00371 [Alphaproteobacteria bacterium ADurb.Bin438]